MLAVILACPPPATPGQGTPDDPFHGTARSFRVFRDRDGLPQNTVQAITRDRAGRLWVGTQDGAAVSDGRTWTRVDMPGRLRSNFVRAICAAGDGSLWFGTRAAGLFQLREGTWSTHGELCRIARCERINALLETVGPGGETILWAGTHGGGLGRLRRGRWTLFTPADGLPSGTVWTLQATRAPGGGTVLWAGTQRGLARLDPGASRFVVERGSPPASVNALLSVTGGRGETVLWAGTYGSGLARRDGRGWTTLGRREGLSSDHITSLAATTDPAGEPVIWVGTDGGGLQRISRGRVEVLSMEDGLPSNAVYSLHALDPAEGPSILWIGTRNGGLAQLVEGTWRKLRIPSSLPRVPVNALLETREADGGLSLWVGTDTRGLWRLHRGRWESFTRTSGRLPSDTVQCLLAEEKAEGGRVLWAGTRNGGLARLENGRLRVFSTRGGVLPSDMVQALLLTRGAEGSPVLWVGTRGGLARLENGEWSHLGLSDGLPHASVTALLETGAPGGQRVLWVGTAGGLLGLEGAGPKTLGPVRGLLNASVQCLLERVEPGGRRTLWVGTDGGGITVLDLTEEAPRPLFHLTDTSDPPLPSNVVSGMVEDPEGRLYVLTNRGVARLTPVAGGATGGPAFTVFTYDADDGLPLNEGNRGAMMADVAGRIWVGTVGGAAAFDPAAEQPDRTADPLLLEATLLPQGTALPPAARLPHDGSHVLFHFDLLSFHDGGLTQYRTRLVGLDARPSPWGPVNRREYGTLPRGTYRFQVWGRDAAGNVTGPLEHSFSVAPAPWLTWWAFGGYGVLLGLGGLLALRLRLRVHRARERELEDLVGARTRRLEEANALLVELSYADALTGVGNRRRFDELVDVECRRAARTRRPLSLVLLDIDLFKAFNDNLGHREGDRCLRRVAARLADALPRAGDSICRYGGDEFAVLLPGTGLQGALLVADQLRSAVEALRIPRRGTAVAFVTISCGVGTLGDPGTGSASPAGLVEMADRGLYRAKERGRNRVDSGNDPG